MIERDMGWSSTGVRRVVRSHVALASPPNTWELIHAEAEGQPSHIFYADARGLHPMSSDLQLLPPELAALSASDHEIVLPYPAAINAVDYLAEHGVQILGWEAWE